MDTNNVKLLGLNLSQLKSLAVDNGESSFRGQQIYQSLYQRGIPCLEEITTLPKKWPPFIVLSSE